MAANEVNIQNWFKEYIQVVKNLGIVSPEQIWSGNETGVQNVPKEDKFLSEVKKPLVNQVPVDQGETSTVLTFVNAVGRVCPPMVIHKGQRVQREWGTNMPISVRLAATTKGYITKQRFHEYTVSFVKDLTLFNLLGWPNLLIIDSPKSHVYNVTFYEERKENNIHVLAIPPHTSHLVQALDSTPFAEFKHCWQRNLLDWLFHNKGVTLSKKCFFDVLWPSFQESMTVAKIQSGFRKTGVFPKTSMQLIRLSLHLHKSQTVRKTVGCWLIEFKFNFKFKIQTVDLFWHYFFSVSPEITHEIYVYGLLNFYFYRSSQCRCTSSRWGR